MEERERGIPVEPVYENEEVRAMDRLEQVNPIQQTKQGMVRDYEISFRFLNSGCVINIGCKSIAFSTTKEAITAFNEYVNDPETAREKWFKKFNEE